MTELQLQPVLDFVLAQWPWLKNVAMFVGLARIAIKPFGEWLKRFITSAAEKASLSLDPEDDTWIEDLLRTRAYKFVAFALDVFVSVKLPAAGDLFSTINHNTAP